MPTCPGDFNGLNGIPFTGAQESVSVITYPEGVYRPFPLKGIISWNSHSFNLTNEDMWLDAYVNIEYADSTDFEAEGGLLGVNMIFIQNIPPFEQREYCATLTFPSGTRFVELSSHTHRHGKHFRMWAPPQPRCVGGSIFTPPVEQSDGTPCGPGNPADLFYQSYDYEDAVYLRYHDDPWLLQGNQAARTLRYCSLYDNGQDNPTEVKRQSTSPVAPGTFIPGLSIGGPCPNSTVACMGGPNKGQLCQAIDANCPESECDACPSVGGFTTEDEMFLMLGFYYNDPE